MKKENINGISRVKRALTANQNVKERDFWLRQLSGELVKSNVPFDYKKIDARERKMNKMGFRFPNTFSSGLLRLSKGSDYSLNAILVTGLTVLLYKYTQGTDIIIGEPIYKHNSGKDTEFINTLLPIRCQVEAHLSFKHLLLQVSQTIRDAAHHYNYPLEMLAKKLGIQACQDQFPFFDIVLLLENVHNKSYISHISPHLIFHFIRTNEHIHGRVEFNSLLYDSLTIEGMITHLTHLFEEVLANLDLSVDQIDILAEKEKKQLLLDFNDTAAEYPGDKAIGELFAEQARTMPDSIAVVFENNHYSYTGIDQHSHRLAQVLRLKGVQPDTIVGIMAQRSIGVIIGFLGILKAGGAYLSIDPGYPAARIQYILEDSKVKILVNESKNPGHQSIEKDIDIILIAESPVLSSLNLPLTSVPVTSLAYVMYTSGTTGQPRGVMVEHRSVARLVKNTNYIDFSRAGRMLQTGALEFDASTFEIWGALLNGLSLYMLTREKILLTDALRDAIESYDIGTMWLTAPLFNQVVESDITVFHGLKHLLVGGDVLSVVHINRVCQKYPGLKIINGYGPTENTTFSTTFLIDREYSCSIPIGSPISNSTVYIMGKDSNLVPLRVPGELLVGGDGVSRGYLNQPQLTMEKIIPNPVVNGDRVYRTGDLGRWLADGTIQFLGRVDDQVKIRGFRIEPGEVEYHLLKHEKIREAVVIIREDKAGEKYLCAYIVPNTAGVFQNATISQELKTYLSLTISDFMIPRYFVLLKKIPLNPNGKVDRRALPIPGADTDGKTVTAPQTLLQKKLVDIWAEVLMIEKEKIGIDSDFFQLGGHSLRATSLVSRIHKMFHVKVPLAEIFKTSTIKALAGWINGVKQDSYTSFTAVEKREYFLLSSVQKRLYVLQQMELASIAYNIPLTSMVEGKLNKQKLEKTFRQLIKRHESLRTSFDMLNGEPVQRIHQEAEFKIEYYKKKEVKVEEECLPINRKSFEGIRGLAPLLSKGPATGNRQLAASTIKNFIRPFDLSRAPLMRVGLIRIEQDKHILMVDMHHSIADGTSMAILRKEMMDFYRGIKLPPLRIQYKDYASWQTGKNTRETLNKQEQFWFRQFEEEITVLNLPTDYARPLIQDFAGNSICFELSREETLSLKTLVLKQGVTLFMVLLAACNTWLSKLSGEEDIVIGTPIAGRRHEELQEIMGMFVNTLALRNYPESRKTFEDFLEEVKAKTLEAFQNQDYTFEDLVDRVVKNRDTSRNPLFDVMLVLQNMEIPQIDIPGLALKPYEYENKTSKFDLNLIGMETDDQLIFTLEYSTKLFKEETARGFAGYFKNMINTITANPSARITDIEIMAKEEKERILELSAGITEPVDLNETIHQMFEKTVLENIDKTALVFRDRRMTYGELNRRANQLARLLRSRGIGPDRIGGLMVERSFELVIGMIAIIKAGGAYLPIDPKFPKQRKQFMIEESNMPALLTNFEIDESAGYIPGKIETIDIKNENIYRGNEANLPNITKGSNLLYVIYTSGSTGKPKGVMLEHTNLVNLIKFHHKYTNIDCSKVSQFSTISFDASFHEIFSALLAGGELYLLDEEMRNNIPGLFEFLGKNKVKTLFLPMSFLKLIFNEDEYINIFPGSVDHIQTAGEQVVVDDRFASYLKEHNIHLHNHYGPSETHVITTLTIRPGEDIPQFPSIGKPVMNTTIYILDKEKHLLPEGVAGELYTGGLQVGRGYLRREEETRNKFINDIFKKGGRLYRTGDLARWLANGNIEFLGRIDHQVKIRGIRVEPGEIENQLKRIEFIQDAVVLVKQQETGDKYLCAYIVLDTVQNPADPGQSKFSQLRDILAADLPDYMVPSYFSTIDKIPLTASGKIDRKALPEPELKPGEKYLAPRDEIEKKMVDIWSEILGVGKDVIGIEDNFFHLGGHSLIAITLIAKINKELNVKLPLSELFKSPTIKKLSLYIQGAEEDKFISIYPAEEKEYYPLSPAQKRLYVMQQIEPDKVTYNMPAVLVLEGKLDKAHLENTFKKLIHRHKSLKTAFEIVDDQPVQRIYDQVEFEMEYYCTGRTAQSAKCNEERHAPGARHWASTIKNFIRPFDLSKVPQVRIGLIKTKEQEHIFMTDMHHIIADGIANQVMIEELLKLYLRETLSLLRLQYKDFSQWQNQRITSGEIEKQQEYWLNEFRGKLPVLDIPTDYQRPTQKKFSGSQEVFVIPPGEAAVLRELARREHATMFMLVLTLCNILFFKLTLQEDIIIGTIDSGRRHPDLDKIIGVFVNTLALRNYPKPHQPFIEFLREVRKRTLDAFENQDYQFEDLVEKLKVERDATRNPLVDVVFSFNQASRNRTANSTPGKGVNPGGPNLKIRPYDGAQGTQAKFDILFTGSDTGEELVLMMEYSTELFKAETIKRFIEYFKEILSAVVADESIQLKDIKISHHLVMAASSVYQSNQSEFNF